MFGINASDDNFFKGYGTEMHDCLNDTDVQNQVFPSANIPVATKIAIHRKVLVGCKVFTFFYPELVYC